MNAYTITTIQTNTIVTRLCLPILLSYCDDYYGVSEACCEWSGHFHIKSKGTLYNAVEIKEFQRILKEPDIDYRKEYGIPSGAKVISFTGRLIPEKGIKQLVSAVVSA